MSSGVINSRVLAKTDLDRPLRESAIGLIVEAEFAAARTAVTALDDYSSYEDWLDSRLGLQMGLAMAGVDATMVEVGFPEFCEWCALAGTEPDEDALDAFAALALRSRDATAPQVLADLDQSDFVRREAELAPIAGSLGFFRWRLERERMRVTLAATGLRVERLPIRVDDFLAWCACVDERVTESNLDRYAQLLLEHLTIQ